MLGTEARSRRVLGVVVGLILAGVLAASPLAAAASPPPRIDAAPLPDLRVGFLQPVQGLSPYLGFNDVSLFLYGLLYDYPFSFDQNGSTVGSVITSASCAVADCSVWNYTVRQGVFWSDGSELTASDVNFTWNYDSQHLLDLWAYEPYFNHVVVCSGGNAGRCGAIPSATNPWNVTLYFDRPFVAGRDLMAPVIQMAQWVNVTPACAQGAYNCTQGTFENPTPIGTGPFIADPNIYNEWLQQPNVPLHLVRNPRYHAVGNVTPTVSIRDLYLYSYGDPNAMASALLAGSLDVAQFTPITIGSVSGKPNILAQTVLMAWPTWNYIGISQIDQSAPNGRLNPARWDTDVRRAMAMATNKDHIVQQFYNGYGTPGSSLISPVTPAFWYDPVAGGDNLTFDVAAANRLLNASGYTTWTGGSFGNGYREATASRSVSFQSACFQCANPPNVTRTIPAGQVLQFTLAVRPPSVYPEEYDTALYLQAQYQQIGVRLTIKAETTEAAFTTDVYNGYVEMYIWFWSGDPDPNYLVSMQSSWTLDGWNDNNWNNGTYNAAYLAQLGDQNTVQRIADVKAAEKIQYDLSPDIITVYPFGTWAMRTDLWQGWGDWGATPYRQLNVPWGANPLFFSLNCPSCEPVSPVLPPTPPVLSPPGPLRVQPGITLSLGASSSDPNASVELNFTWYWGDGSVTNQRVNSTNPQVIASHAWASLGTYVVRVQVYDGWNAPVWSQNEVTVDVVSQPGGTGWVAGLVTNAALQPLRGAAVTASPGAETTTTNATGAYNLTLFTGAYSVSAAAPFFDPAYAGNVVVTENRTTVVNFLLVPAVGWIAGTVVDAATDAPLSEVSVMVTASGGSSQAASTDTQGRFNVTAAPGTYTVDFSKTGYLAAAQSGLAVTSNATTAADEYLVPTPNPIVLQLASVLAQPGHPVEIFGNVTTPGQGGWLLEFGDGTNASASHAAGTTPVTVSHVYSAEGTYTLTLIATSYRIASSVNATAVVDGTPPVTTASLSGTGVSGSWFRSAVTVTLSATDARSGLAAIQYSLDNGPFQAYTVPFQISSDGLHTLAYRSTDKAGNVEMAHTVAVGVDTTPPSLQFTAPASGGTVTSSGVTFSWSASDTGSGVASYAISVDGAPRENVGMDTAFATNLADGSHTISVWAFDGVGNNISKSLTFRVDTNVFSPSGPYAGAPTYTIIAAAAVVAAVVLWRRKKRNPPASRPLEEQR